MLARIRSFRRDEQAGFTLVELLVTVTIMAISFVVILTAMAVFIRSTTVQRASADLDGAMRTYVERIAAATYDPTCPTDYGSVAVPAGFTASIQVRYWDGNPTPAGFAATCPATDKGSQQVTVMLTRVANGQTDQLVIVKRQP